jgi:hypothetical protein
MGSGGLGSGGSGTGGIPGTGGAGDRCRNAARDGDESDVDCGGTSGCPRCTEGTRCNTAGDCMTGSQCAFAACRAKFPPVDAGLVGYWPLNTDPRDLSGNANHATAYRSATVAPGKVGGGYQFAGDGCLLVPDSASLDMVGLSTLSMMAWVNYAGGCGVGDDVTMVVNKENSYEMAVSCFDAAYQNAIMPMDQTWGWQGTKILTTNTWYHLVTVWDTTVLRLYVDGALVDAFPLTGQLADRASGLGMGCRSVPPDATTGGLRTFFNGIIDEVAIYRRVLSPEEIAAYHARTR